MIKSLRHFFIFLKKTTWIAFLAIFFAFFFKLFIASYYVVPSESMQPTLLPGDGILISKLHYGPRLDLHSLFLFNKTQIGYRIPGFSDVKRGDLVVFNSPVDLEKNLVKRCVAVPGDTLVISQSNLIVNRHLINYHPIFDFQLVSNDSLKTANALFLLKIRSAKKRVSDLSVKFFLSTTKENANLLARLASTDSLSRKYRVNKNGNISPYGLFWTKDDYGPLIIPQKGLTVILNAEAIKKYGPLIKKESPLQIKGDKVLLGGKTVNSYTFKYNYYFMLGDFRDRSYDSRWIGLIPEHLIIGKPICILYSRSPWTHTMRFNRLFKLINY